MDIEELGKILRAMYEQEWGGGKTTAIHLFGIQFHNEIDALGRGAVQWIVRESGINPSYHVEVSKGVKLGEHVHVVAPYVGN